jgi:hypothetical protein
MTTATFNQTIADALISEWVNSPVLFEAPTAAPRYSDAELDAVARATEDFKQGRTYTLDEADAHSAAFLKQLYH